MAKKKYEEEQETLVLANNSEPFCDAHKQMKELTQKRRTGGRQKGTPNKVTTLTKQIIHNLLDDYQESGLMASDFMDLKPKERIDCAERLMQYVLPRMQATAIDLDMNVKKVTIEQTLRDLSKINDK